MALGDAGRRLREGRGVGRGCRKGRVRGTGGDKALRRKGRQVSGQESEQSQVTPVLQVARTG